MAARSLYQRAGRLMYINTLQDQASLWILLKVNLCRLPTLTVVTFPSLYELFATLCLHEVTSVNFDLTSSQAQLKCSQGRRTVKYGCNIST